MKAPPVVLNGTLCPICRSGEHFPKRIHAFKGNRVCLFHIDLYREILLCREELVDPSDPERFRDAPLKRIMEKVRARHMSPAGKHLVDEI